MGFNITTVEVFKHPEDQKVVDEVLYRYQSTVPELVERLKTHVFQGESANQGFQVDLSRQLQDFFQIFFQEKGFIVYSNGHGIRYSNQVDLRADAVIRSNSRSKGIFIEIEFRPNEHKDIVKFEIGHKNNLTELAILLVAIDRRSINVGYTTMPQFKSCKNLVKEFQPRCPLLLIGIDGQDS